MPTIIDSLLVTLGLDASQYRKEAAAARDDQDKVVDQSDKMAKRLESDGKRAAQSFRTVRNEVAGLLLAFTGAASIKTFASSILTNDAAVGRLASNLGVATDELSKWEAVVQRVGGQAGDADSTFRSLKGIFNDVRLTGDMSKYGDLAGLGIRDVNQLKNPTDALMTIAGTGEHMDRSEFAARLGRLGISDSMITLLGKGRAGLSAYLAEQEKLGHATEESSRQAQRYEDTMARFESILREKVRPVIVSMVEWFDTWATSTGNLQIAGSALVGVVGALATAALIAAGPFTLLAAAIAAVALAYERLSSASGHKRIAENTQANGKAFGDLIHGNIGAAWHDFWHPDRSGSDGAAPRDAGSVGGTNAGIVAYLKRAGFSDAQAAGINAGIVAEGNGQTNRKSGAFGIGQWLGNRKKGLFARYGTNPTREQQMAYLVWELNGGDHGGASVRGQTTADGTLNAYIRNFMRPARGAETTGDLSRGMAVLGGRMPRAMAGRTGGSSTQTTSVGQITIYTASTDAKGLARDLPKALADRGLTVQSASGMNP